MNEKTFDEVVAGQKAILEATKEIINGKPLPFVIGAISALEGQAKSLENHILDTIPDHLNSMVLLKTAQMLYRRAVSTEIMSYKKEVEDEEYD